MRNLHLHPCHRRIFRAQNNIFKIEILICSTQIPDLKSLDLDFLDQTLVIGIQRIQNINQIVLFCVGCRIVQREKGVKPFQRFLGGRIFFAHLLRLVQNQDRPVGGNDVNGPSGAKFVPFGINDTRGSITLATFHILLFIHGRSKRLRIDNHHIDAGIAGEGVKLIQIAAVVNEEPGFLAVVLHKMVSSNLKSLFNALTDCNTRHNHNKLTPAVASVQLEHGFDIYIGLAGAGLHLHIQRHPAKGSHQRVRLMDIALLLQIADVLKQLGIGQLECFVFISDFGHQILKFKLSIIFQSRQKPHLSAHVGECSYISHIGSAGSIRLSLKCPHDRFDSICLILLYLKCKFHHSTFLTVSGL